MHLRKTAAVEAERTGRHVTARGPDTLSQDRKGSLAKVNKKRGHINGGTFCCQGEKVAFKAQHPHIYRTYHLNGEATWT